MKQGEWIARRPNEQTIHAVHFNETREDYDKLTGKVIGLPSVEAAYCMAVLTR